ncbi:GAF domain-containing protein [Marinobacterium aestuariivivens]|uniref:GAF domain-containing protein n=1 Tax=Marinobacterium aestuariivivens TaxID=1698799 RepID=A0ABW1ZY94_9GAMM
MAPPGAALRNGDDFELSTTYCSMVLASGDVIAIDHMSQSEYAGHPCFDAFRLECYIGVPVWVNGELYGTLNFSSSKPYERHFDASDLEFMRLLGRWVGVSIAEEHSLDELKRLATTDSLTGVSSRGSLFRPSSRSSAGPGATTRRCRCCCSISTTSRRSTIASGIRPETRR